MAVVLAWLWNERFWFPVNVTWADLEQKTPEAYRVGHLLAAFPLAAGLLVLRHFFESMLDEPCKQDYFSVFQPITPDIYYYYVFELAHYLSLMYSQFTDIKRKDFFLMFVHHVAAVVLLICSYINKMVRIGTLVICLHDSGDILLELAKLFNYAKYQRLCDATFVLFGVVFLITRLGIFPIWILNSTMFESWELVGPYPSWWLFNSLLLILQVLHIIWSYFIIRIACKAMARGKVLRDERSDVESSSEDDVTSNNRKGIINTSSNDCNRINGHVISDQWAEE
ncbi:ceramide synthase 5 [Pseudonaja textilis]|uniref:ceramide synthase 5 n=1 Tax=Pseudonaja textilis TaxID=8673 RepID=UPI000EAA0B54|nr:ceramide synthase 5 [Pseudonaja textilis]